MKIFCSIFFGSCLLLIFVCFDEGSSASPANGTSTSPQTSNKIIKPHKKRLPICSKGRISSRSQPCRQVKSNRRRKNKRNVRKNRSRRKKGSRQRKTTVVPITMRKNPHVKREITRTVNESLYIEANNTRKANRTRKSTPTTRKNQHVKREIIHTANERLYVQANDTRKANRTSRKVTPTTRKNEHVKREINRTANESLYEQANGKANKTRKATPTTRKNQHVKREINRTASESLYVQANDTRKANGTRKTPRKSRKTRRSAIFCQETLKNGTATYKKYVSGGNDTKCEKKIRRWSSKKYRNRSLKRNAKKGRFKKHAAIDNNGKNFSDTLSTSSVSTLSTTTTLIPLVSTELINELRENSGDETIKKTNGTFFISTTTNSTITQLHQETLREKNKTKISAPKKIYRRQRGVKYLFQMKGKQCISTNMKTNKTQIMKKKWLCRRKRKKGRIVKRSEAEANSTNLKKAYFFKEGRCYKFFPRLNVTRLLGNNSPCKEDLKKKSNYTKYNVIEKQGDTCLIFEREDMDENDDEDHPKSVPCSKLTEKIYYLRNGPTDCTLVIHVDSVLDKTKRHGSECDSNDKRFGYYVSEQNQCTPFYKTNADVEYDPFFRTSEECMRVITAQKPPTILDDYLILEPIEGTSECMRYHKKRMESIRGSCQVKEGYFLRVPEGCFFYNFYVDKKVRNRRHYYEHDFGDTYKFPAKNSLTYKGEDIGSCLERGSVARFVYYKNLKKCGYKFVKDDNMAGTYATNETCEENAKKGTYNPTGPPEPAPTISVQCLTYCDENEVRCWEMDCQKNSRDCTEYPVEEAEQMLNTKRLPSDVSSSDLIYWDCFSRAWDNSVKTQCKRLQKCQTEMKSGTTCTNACPFETSIELGYMDDPRPPTTQPPPTTRAPTTQSTKRPRRTTDEFDVKPFYVQCRPYCTRDQNVEQKACWHRKKACDWIPGCHKLKDHRDAINDPYLIQMKRLSSVSDLPSMKFYNCSISPWSVSDCTELQECDEDCHTICPGKDAEKLGLINSVEEVENRKYCFTNKIVYRRVSSCENVKGSCKNVLKADKLPEKSPWPKDPILLDCNDRQFDSMIDCNVLPIDSDNCDDCSVCSYDEAKSNKLIENNVFVSCVPNCDFFKKEKCEMVETKELCLNIRKCKAYAKNDSTIMAKLKTDDSFFITCDSSTNNCQKVSSCNPHQSSSDNCKVCTTEDAIRQNINIKGVTDLTAESPKSNERIYVQCKSYCKGEEKCWKLTLQCDSSIEGCHEFENEEDAERLISSKRLTDLDNLAYYNCPDDGTVEDCTVLNNCDDSDCNTVCSSDKAESFGLINSVEELEYMTLCFNDNQQVYRKASCDSSQIACEKFFKKERLSEKSSWPKNNPVYLDCYDYYNDNSVGCKIVDEACSSFYCTVCPRRKALQIGLIKETTPVPFVEPGTVAPKPKVGVQCKPFCNQQDRRYCRSIDLENCQEFHGCQEYDEDDANELLASNSLQPHETDDLLYLNCGPRNRRQSSEPPVDCTTLNRCKAKKCTTICPINIAESQGLIGNPTPKAPRISVPNGKSPSASTTVPETCSFNYGTFKGMCLKTGEFLRHMEQAEPYRLVGNFKKLARGLYTGFGNFFSKPMSYWHDSWTYVASNSDQNSKTGGMDMVRKLGADFTGLTQDPCKYLTEFLAVDDSEFETFITDC